MEGISEGEIILSLLNHNLFEEEKTGFLVQESWWNEWNAYAHRQGPRPEKMKNSEILIGFDIRHQNTKLINKAAWEILKDVYDGRPEVEVFIIDKIPDYKPINIIVRIPGEKSFDMQLVSRKITAIELAEYVLSKSNLSYNNLSIYFESKLLDNYATLESQGVKAGSRIAIESDDVRVNVESESKQKNDQRYDNSHFAFEQAKKPNRDIVIAQIQSAIEHPKQSIKIKQLKDIKEYIDHMVAHLDEIDVV